MKVVVKYKYETDTTRFNFTLFEFICVYVYNAGGDRLSEDLEIMIGRRLPVLIRLTGTIITPAVVLV